MSMVTRVTKLAILGFLAVSGLSRADNVLTAQIAQLPQGDPARKLAVLHYQEILLERMVSGVCFVDAGIEAERHRADVYDARDRFEKTLPDIVAEVNNLDPQNPTARRLQREIERKRELWYRFRIFVERELKAETPRPDVLAQMALLEDGLAGTVEKIYRVVRRDLTKKGTVTLADTIEENGAFTRLYTAERMVKEACIVAMGGGDALERAKLDEAINYLERTLDDDEGSMLAPAKVKSLVPAWRALMPELRALVQGEAASPDLLARLDALRAEWSAAVGAPGLKKDLG